jgi:hypothetical protein
MPELPACVRIALWVTDAWSRGVPTETALKSALPDLDAVGGDVGHLDLWRDLGEQALVVALPGPGHAGELAGLSPDAFAAATEAQECILAPTLGGVLVPAVRRFGPDGPGTAALDRGTRLDLTAYDGAPVPRHRIEASSARHALRSLREAMAQAGDELNTAGGQPFDATTARATLGDSARQWALPDGLSPDVRAAIMTAGEVGRAATLGLTHSGDALTVTSHDRRTSALRRLERAADAALAEATNAGVALLAGWVPQGR